jgi:hypothetical protein
MFILLGASVQMALIDITHLRRASEDRRVNARSSKESDGSLLTPSEMFGKRTASVR